MAATWSQIVSALKDAIARPGSVASVRYPDGSERRYESRLDLMKALTEAEGRANAEALGISGGGVIQTRRRDYGGEFPASSGGEGLS